MRLSDEQVADVRRLVAGGMSHHDAAERAGCSRSAVTRIVAGDRRAVAPVVVTEPCVLAAVTAALDGAELEPRDRALAAVAVGLAGRLDGLLASDAAAAATAAERVAGRLQDLLEQLLPVGAGGWTDGDTKRVIEEAVRVTAGL